MRGDNRKHGSHSRGGRSRRSLLSALYGAFVAGGAVFAIIFALNVGDVVKAMGNHVPGIPVPIVSKGTAAGGADWGSKERVNVLLLGLDERPVEAGSPSRTDTIMVATLDPAGKTASLLSIPRDLMVSIRLSNGMLIQDRINTAYFYGEYYHNPGGGIALVQQQVEELLGIHIHYYALINFGGLKKMVDALGGVTVTLDQPLIDNAYPTDNYGFQSIYLPAGPQHLDGEKALWYARSRHMDSDFGRMQRQQKLMLAIKDRALQLGAIFRIPFFLNELGGALKTDLSLSEMKSLTDLSKDIKSQDIVNIELDEHYVTDANIAGASVLLLKEDTLPPLVRELFYDPRLSPQPVHVEVVNNTGRTDTAAQVGALLQEQGFSDISFGECDGGCTEQQTTIYDPDGANPAAAHAIAKTLGIPPGNIDCETQEQGGSSGLRVVLAGEVELSS